LTDPYKQQFADLINQVTGKQQMTEQKLDRILREAKRAHARQGMPGFFAYMRKLIQAPVSNEYMMNMLQQLQDPRQAEQLLQQVKSEVKRKGKS
jgi:hypothetical protein